MTRHEAMLVVVDHIRWLRGNGRNSIADALEYVLQRVGRNGELAHFEVQGAGELEVGNALDRTGTAVGPHVGVSWGQWGYAGGVMDTAEVHRLVDHLIGVVGDKPAVPAPPPG